MKTEIWIRGKLFTTIDQTNDNGNIRDFEQIVKRAGYEIDTREENGKIIMMI